MLPTIVDRHGVQQSWDWMVGKYGNIRYLEANAAKKFALVRVKEQTGNALIKVIVLNEAGQPHSGQPVANHWPDEALPDLSWSGSKSLWQNRGVHQDTDANGITGFGLGTGSYISDLAVGGPHTLWVLSPTLPSDGLSGIGMLGGTNHEGMLELTFQITEMGNGDDDIPNPDPTETGQKQRVLDKAEKIADRDGTMAAAPIYIAIARVLSE